MAGSKAHRAGMGQMFASQRRKVKKYLLDRYGDECYYCGEPTTSSDRSVEHLVPTADGGSNDYSNLRLVHKDCNNLVGELTLADKMWVRRRLRGKGKAGWAGIEREVKRRKVKWAKARSSEKVRTFGTVTPREEASAERALRAWGLDS